MKQPTLGKIFRQALLFAKIPHCKSLYIYSEKRHDGQRLRIHSETPTNEQVQLMRLYIDDTYPRLKCRIGILKPRCNHIKNTMTPTGLFMHCELSSKNWRKLPEV